MTHSAIYAGNVGHRRLRPRAHRLNYRVYSLLLDLDELEILDQRLRFFSVNRFNLFSFYTKDRGSSRGGSLREQVERAMRSAGIIPDGGRIALLTIPRVLGWSFNPLSVFFCYGADESLRAILWEVDNTFGQRHGYMLPVDHGERGVIAQTCAKELYVSPFMEMDQRYEFRVKAPAENLWFQINSFDHDGLILTTHLAARKVELTDASLIAAFLKMPFLTLKVVAAIHWEALKLWLKGVRLVARRPPPGAPVFIPPNPARSIHED